eukprot:Em0021g861a
MVQIYHPPPTSPPKPSLTSPPQPPPTSSQAPSLTIEQPSSVPLATPPLLSSFVASSKSLSCDSVKVKMSDVENPTSNIGAQANSSGAQTHSSGAQAHPKPPVASRPKSFSNGSHPRPVSSHPFQADGTGPTGGTGDEEPRQHGSVGGSSPVRDRKLNAKTVPTTRSPQANQSPRKGTAESPHRH